MGHNYSNILEKAGYERFCGIGEDSGLMIFSKFEIIDIVFDPFDKSTAENTLANKGTLRALLKLNDHKTLNVINTHLDTDPDTARGQLRELSRYIIPGNTVVAGDLNLDFLTHETRGVEIIHGNTVYDQASRNADTTITGGEKIIDYFVIIDPGLSIQSLVIHDMVEYSDHYPVKVELKVND